jgi:hypothetical protein
MQRHINNGIYNVYENHTLEGETLKNKEASLRDEGNREYRAIL